MIPRGFKKLHALAVLIVAGSLLGGCASVPGKTTAPQIFELGMPTEGQAARFPLGAIEVSAPSWLASGAMQYRLEYERPAQRRSYGASRWASPPAEMLERFIARSLAGPIVPGAAVSRCRLRVELDDFVQTFSATTESAGLIQARVLLLPARGDTVLASRFVQSRTVAPTPDAAGGVIAQQSAATEVAKDLALWLEGLEPLRERCR